MSNLNINLVQTATKSRWLLSDVNQIASRARTNASVCVLYSKCDECSINMGMCVRCQNASAEDAQTSTVRACGVGVSNKL